MPDDNLPHLRISLACTTCIAQALCSREIFYHICVHLESVFSKKSYFSFLFSLHGLLAHFLCILHTAFHVFAWKTPPPFRMHRNGALYTKRPSPSAHYVRIHLSQGERPWQRDEVCVDCQGLPPRGSWHRAAMTERVQTEEVPLYIGIKPGSKDHTTSVAGARRSFPPVKCDEIVHLAQKKRNSTKQRK